MDNSLREYECVCVFNAEVEGDLLEKEISNIETVVSSNSGELLNRDHWKRRGLAYEIKGKGEGTFFIFRFRLPQEKLGGIDYALRFNESLLRYRILRY